MENGKINNDAVKVLELKKRFLHLKLSFWQGEQVKTSDFKKIKKEIARIKTAARK